MNSKIVTNWEREGPEWWTIVSIDAVLFLILAITIIALLVWIFFT